MGVLDVPVARKVGKDDWFYDARLSGVVANGTDKTTELLAAIAAARTATKTLLLPPGNIGFSAQLTFTRQNVLGCGRGATTLTCLSSLGAGVPAIVVNGTTGGTESPTIKGFSLIGPGPRTLGVKTANCDGISIQQQVRPLLEDLDVKQFDSGIVWANDYGHIWHRYVNATNNYYGIYAAVNNSDYFISECEINGNSFAGIGMPANSGIAEFRIENSHLGFQPFAIYQEATPTLTATGFFLQEGTFSHARFEAIGNAAIWTEAPFSIGATFKKTVSDLKFDEVGYSSNATYNVASAPSGYAVQFPLVIRISKVFSGPYPFPTWHIQQMASTASLQVIDTTTALANFTVDNGGTAGVLIGTNEADARSGKPMSYVTNSLYSAPGTRTTGTRPNGTATYLPIRIVENHTFTALSLEVTSAGSTGALLRLGVYADSGGKPGTLLLDAGTVDGTTTGIKTISSLSLTLAPGWYYLAAVTQGSPTTLPTVRTIGAGNNVPGAPVYPASLSSGAGWNQSSVTAAFANASGPTVTDTVILVALTA